MRVGKRVTVMQMLFCLPGVVCVVAYPAYESLAQGLPGRVTSLWSSAHARLGS